jgi:hypothetical protein
MIREVAIRLEIERDDFQTQTGDYDYVLPNFNFNIEVGN